jgi:superfamily II DNA or RNA helicase
MTDDLNLVSGGLYELLLTAGLELQLAHLGDALQPTVTSIESAEVANRIAFHLGSVIERAIGMLPGESRVELGVGVARALVERLEQLVEKSDCIEDAPVLPGRVLEAIQRRLPDGSFARVEKPLIPLLDTTLLTNAPGEPRVGRQVQAEVESADGIDLLMAFIRRTGLANLIEPLRRHCQDGKRLRVLTTTYTGSTEARALEVLQDLGADIRVSYDTTSTRLHAKAWLFRRESGFSTAYIGSSNLTYSAQVSGLEWNVRVSGARNPDVVDKIDAVFESYWESGDFRAYNAEEFGEQTRSQRQDGPRIFLSPVEIRPEPFQERLLEQLAVSRAQGHHRNLLVAATGTGKTVMAALDYLALRATLPRARLLFVAHRKEILDQCQATFRHALREPSFGEQWVGGNRPVRYDYVFASVQSLNVADLADLPADHFDVVIIDEFHHAAAPTYDRLLKHVEPRELVGLTATPERADGHSILGWFEGRIAAELRLWDAIDQHYLTPFLYFGIHDGLDLREVPWKRGRGYDIAGLTNIYTGSDPWARRVVKELLDRADDPETMRVLGFCVSVEHARYMARKFEESGIHSVAIWGESPMSDREEALSDLAKGKVRVVFSVDLFNEGIDVPTVDALLMLRPTESPTLFLQQLGRGLRKSAGKTSCLVLDFVGQHRREFRFDQKMRALLGGTRKELERHIQGGFPYLPAGCHMELDTVASKIVLQSIRESIPTNWPRKVEDLRRLVDAGHEATLANYIEHSGLELEDCYSGKKSWSDLCESADVSVMPSGPQEAPLRRAVGRLLHVNDGVRCSGYSRLLSSTVAPRVASMPVEQRRLTRMLVAPLVDQVLDKTADLQAGVDVIWEHPQVRREVLEVLELLRGQIGHVQPALEGRPDVPLRVHARYSRLEIMVAFGVGAGAKVAPWQTGCRWVAEENADLFAITLNKTGAGFSPTTRYRDYAISRNLVHWESQSVTRADSPTGRRYQEHLREGSEIMLFARLHPSDRSFWFLGPAVYVRHEGERPMAIVWKLEFPLPGDLFASFAAAVA